MILKAGLIILVGAWVPLFAVGLADSTANPIGLGLFAWGGSLLGAIVTVVGLFVATYRLLRRR
jgi:hypothetical protein